jgi:hypothetical protein
MKQAALMLAIAAMPLLSHAQADRPFGKYLVVGTSVTYIWDHNRDITQNVFHETTWDKNIAVSLTNSLYLGLGHKSIFTRGSSYIDGKRDRERYFMTGAFIQYDFIPHSKNRLFAELSYNIGDYCTCGHMIDPYRISLLYYLGFGGGIDLPLWKNISLDLAFINYHILDKIPQKYSYTQYIIGLNYTLVRSAR